MYSSIIKAALQAGASVTDLSTGEIITNIVPVRQTHVPGREEATGGLSMGHISTWKDGNLVEVKAKPVKRDQVGGGIRSKIKTFSVKSRRRLMQAISKVKKSIIPVFITLTYPGEFSGDPSRWKRDLKVMAMRLKRSFPKFAAIWKLEFQKRGAPHYHLLAWGADYQDLKLKTGLMWYQVVGSGDDRHLRAGVRVEKVRSWRGVMAYASKYLGKVQDGGAEVGRYWGMLYEEDIPWGEIITRSITDREAFQFIRLLRRKAGIKSRAYRSLTIYTNSDFWEDRIDRLLFSFSL